MPTKIGECHGIAFWFDLCLDQTVRISSLRDDPSNHWKQAVLFFDEEMKVAPGKPVHIAFSRDEISLNFNIA